jgi:hypothetical protein
MLKIIIQSARFRVVVVVQVGAVKIYVAAVDLWRAQEKGKTG